MHILHHVYTPGEDQVFELQLLYQRITFFGVIFIVHAAHNVEPDIGHPGGQLKEGVDHGLDVLDRGQTHHRTDIHPAILLFERDIAEPLVLDAVWNNDALFSIAPHLDLRPAGIIEQTADPERPPVDLL